MAKAPPINRRFLAASFVATVAAIYFGLQKDPEPVVEVLPEPTPVTTTADASEFKTRFVAVAHAISIAEFADAEKQPDAEAAAFAKCEAERLKRFNQGNYTVEKCEQFTPLNNVFGPVCGILLKNNIVGNVGARWIIGPTEQEVQQAARSFLRREDPAVFNNRDNPYASAVQICVTDDARVKRKDLSYELSR